MHSSLAVTIIGFLSHLSISVSAGKTDMSFWRTRSLLELEITTLVAPNQSLLIRANKRLGVSASTDQLKEIASRGSVDLKSKGPI